jgi:hypothetical protein
MQTDKTVKVTGTNIDGKPREYTFRLVTAETGLKLFHEQNFASMFMAANEALRTLKDGDGLSVVAVVQAFTGMVEWDKMQELSALFIAGAYIDDGENPFSVGTDGILEIAQGDPVEQYLAFAYALHANFPKYVPFFQTDENEGTDEQAPEPTPEPTQKTRSPYTPSAF